MIEEVESEGGLRANVEAYPRRWLLGAVIGTMAFGTVFYHFVEGWSFIDSFYFSAMTLATVGYGDFSPQTDIGKLVTVGYVFFGLGVIAAFIDISARDRLQRRYEREQAQSGNARFERIRQRRQRRSQRGTKRDQ